jgi:hypothetical protein
VCDRSDQAAHYHNLGPQLGASLLTRHIGWKQKQKEKKKKLTNKAVPWLVAGLSTWRPGFMSGSIHMEFVVKVAVGKVFVSILQFFPVNMISPWLFMFVYHLGHEQ